MKLSLLVVIILGGVFVISGFRILQNTFQAAFVNVQKGGTASDTRGTNEASGYNDLYDAKYSFSEDDDKDGLANAWEFIFAVSPQQEDTDGDGYSDGGEVKNGFDPNSQGSTKIKGDPTYEKNLTIQYLLWSLTSLPGVIPKLETGKVNQFIQETIDTSLHFKSVEESEILVQSEDSKETVLAYFQKLREVPLPTVTESYFDVLKRSVAGDIQNLDKLMNQLVVIRGQLQTIPVPPAAKEVHKKYIGLIDVLLELFGDLYGIERDPVRLAANLQKGIQLVNLIKDIELSSQEILKQYSD